MEQFGMPKSGVEEFGERFYQGISGGSQEANGLVWEDAPSAEGVVKRVDWAEAAQKKLQQEEEMAKKVCGLRSLVLLDKHEDFRKDVGSYPELDFMTNDKVRADKEGFNMLLGGELSRAIGGGDTYGVLKNTIEAMPKEQQLEAMARMKKCDTEKKAKALLGELWGSLVTKDFEEQMAEREKKVAEMKAARKELTDEYDATGLIQMMHGNDIPWQLRDVARLEKAGLKPEDMKQLMSSHKRASKAWDKLMRWMYGTSYSEAKMNAAKKGEELMAEWDTDRHLPWTDKPSVVDFYQQGAAELSESFDLSREQMAELVLDLTDEAGNADEQAMALFLQALEKEAKSNQTVIYSKFWRNFGEAMDDWGRETEDYLTRNKLRERSAGVYNGISGYPVQLAYLPGGQKTIDEAKRYLAREYGAKVESLKGYLTRFDRMRMEPAERRLSYMTDMLTKLGTTAGQGVPMLVANMAIPGWGGVAAGGVMMYPALANEAIAENYARGEANAELLGNIEGAWGAASETLFAAYGGGFASKGLKAVGLDKLLGKVALKTQGIPIVGKVLGAAQGNALARYGASVAFESFGEIVVEETVAETGTYATVQGLRALGVDLNDREWAPFKTTLQILEDPGQTGAVIAYCASLGLLGVSGNIKAARQFAADRKMLLQVGLSEEGIAEVQKSLGEYRTRVHVRLDAERENLDAIRAEAEAKAVEEAEAKAGRPLAEEEVAKAKQEAGDKAVLAEVERIRDEEQEPLNEKMREVYDRDVTKYDPVALKKRMEARGKQFLEDVETQLYAESGVMEYVLKNNNILLGDRTAEGKYKVQLPGAKEGETHEVEWTEEQLMAYVAMERNSGMVQTMRELQARVAGEALAKADMSIGGELVNLAEQPTKALARMERNGGRVDYAVLKDLAEEAREKISGFVAGGMSLQEARGQMSELPGVSLGALANTAESFVKRVDEAFATGEAQELGLKKPEDAATNVFRVNKAGSAGQSILLYNRGRMNEREFVEDHIERDVVAAVEGENATTNWEALEAMLKRVDGEMVKNGGKRIFKKGATGKASVIEAFSKLAQSYFLLNHGKYDMSAEAHATIEYVHKQLADAQYLMALSHAWDAFAQSKAGKEYMQKEGASLEKLLSDAGASVAGKYAAAKFDSDAFNAVREAYEGSSMPSPEAAKPVLEQYEEEMKELDHPEAEGEPVVVEAQESITGEQLVLEDEPLIDEATGELVAPAEVVQQEAEQKGRGLAGGKYVEMEGGSVLGVAAVSDIELSEDVPQFKKKESAAGRVEADADGTTHELAGGWNANSAPIHVWRRADGRLEVISGRHRLAHAKKNGVKYIGVRVYDESAEHDASWAKLHDVEQNILDNTCNAIDVAYYFRHNPMPLGEAEARGLMPKTKQGEQTAASRIGLYVAANASEDTFAMMVNGKCTAEDAYMACIVASSAEGQQLALETRAGTKGKKNSWEYVTALVRGAEQMQPADVGMLDLFGNDTAFREQSEKIARYVAAVRAGLKSQLNVLQSAGRLNKKGAVSKSLGVSVKTPKDMSRLIERLARLDAAYERLDYELGIPAKVDAWDGKSAVPTKLDELDPGKLYVAKDVANGDVSYSIIGPKAKTWGKYKDRAFEGRDDGMLRAEIDASGAKLKNLGVSDEYAEQEAGMLLWKVDKFVEGLSAEKRELLEKYIEVYKSDYPAENREEARKEKIRLEEVNKETLDALHAELGGMVDRLWIEAILPGVDYREVEMRTQVREYYEKNIKLGELRYLRDVLDFEELYEAYPQLRHISVSFEKLSAGTNAQVVRSNGKDSIVLSESLLRYPERQMLSSLLHEVQHVIQGIEGFAQGGNEYSARIAANNKRRYPFTEWIDGKSDYELYQRLAGEIEARNVQHRMDWPMDERDSYPFNSTLEYPGEAITPITFSLNGKEYFSDKDGNPVSFEELIERSRQGHEELFAELMKAATPEMREAVAKIEAVLSGKLDKSFRYRDLTAEEVEFFESRTGVDFSDYEWRIVPRALLQSTTHTLGKREWGLTETELKLLPYFIDSMMQNKETLAVSLGNVNAKGVRSLMVELENPITNTKLVFEASSKKHKRRPTKTKEAPRLSLSSAKMLLIQRAGLAPARTPHSVPSGDFNLAENAEEVKQNLLKQEFSSKDTSINSTKAPAVFGAVEDKLGGWQKGTVNVDIGGGKFDTLTQKLAEKGVTNYIYEPFGRSINANAYILAQLQARKNLGDTATCSNVLNVIKEAEIRANVVHQVAKAINPDGVAYFTIYEGDKTGRGKKTKDDCWQNNRKTATYVEEVKQFFGDVELKGGVIVARAPLHVNEPAVWKLGSESETDFVTFSLSSTEAEGLFEDGVMMADNAVVTEPGVSFSIEALHASPHNFRKFSTDFMGSGEGAQVYGWGLYFATSTGVNRKYFNQFRRAMQYDYAYRINGERVSDEQALEMIPGLSETAHPSNLLDALKSREVTRSFVPVVKETIKEWKSYRASREAVRKSYVEHLPKDEERLERNIAKLSDRTKKKKRKEHEENVARMLRGFDEDISRLSADLEALEKVLEWAKAGNKLEYKSGGLVHNYRVELNVEDSNLLDWDKACVTPELREGLKELGISDKAGEFDFRASTGQYVYRELESHFESKKAASEWLAARGYKGIKYLDGLSRKKGKGTYNYVVFSGADVKITAIQSREEWAPRAGWKKYEDETATFSLGMTAEMADIKAAAEAEGAFMKAPNGKPSNLNAVQWMQVRTKAFKRWFGDWENDPANASRVVDENGEPLVVYHGTRSTFTVFDRAEGGQSNKYAQVGFWFSPIKGFGERFAWNAWWGDGEAQEMAVFLNMRNPKVFEGRKGEPYGDAYEQFRTDVVALLGKDAEFANIGGLGMAWHKGYNKMGIPNYMTSAEERAVIDEYREKLKAEGYDGIVIKQTEYDYSTAGSANDQYVVFESAQIKSATDNRGTFDGGNADITYSLSGPSILDAAPTGRMAVEEKMQRLLNYARKEAARWGRTFSKETPNAKAAEAMGTVSSLLASIHKELPPMYRPRVESHLRYVEVYARLIESGKIRTYGKLSKEQRAEVEAELMEVLREEQQRVDAEYEQAKAEALQAAALTGEMAALEEAEKMDVEDEVQRAAYLERVAKRAEAEARKRLLAEAEAKKKQLDAEVEALKREFGAEKLGAIAKRMLTDAANSVERYLIDEELATVPKLLERLAPKKLPNGKYDKGRMSADGYRKFVRYVEMIEADAETVAERMEALGLQIAAEEAKSDAEGNADKLDELQAELAEWSTYGNLRGKQLEAVRAGVRALADFAAYEKNAWQGMLQLKRERVKRQALTAAEALGGADEHKVKAVKDKERRLVSMLGNLGASMKSLAQMFYSMGGVPELRSLAEESVDALSAGHVALTLREKRAYEQLAEYMKSIGLDTENKRNDWMVALKKLHDTGICKAGELVRHRLKLTPEDAAVWLSMTKAERDAKRAELGAEADKQGVLPENVPYEEDMPLLRDALDAYNGKPEGKKWVHTEREFRRPAPTETMKLSKDEALNILLLCEQKDYIEAADENGYTDEVLDQLREFVDNDVLGFGYAMREVLENNGLAEVYEAREGVPFPKVANYWPGNFDQSARANEQANALDPTSGNGTRYGMLISRVKHKLRFNILGASNVFMAALAQQNNYIVVGELTAKWRGLLSHSDFAMSLRQYMGDAEFRQLKELINLLDGAGVQESITQQTLSGLMGQMQSAHAMAVLAGSPMTLVKQVSAMLNAGAWQGVSMLRVLSRIVLDRFENGAIRYADMLKKDYFQARYRDNRYFTEMLQLGNDANWSRLSKWARMAMRGIEAMDVLTNCASMTALYNITYEDLTQRNEGAADPLTETEIHAECDRAVRNALELGAQPLRRTQKSAFAALSRNALVRMTCYMSSEAINKLGMTMAIRRRTGGGANGVFKAWKYLAGISLAQQIVVMFLDMARGAAPSDDDEWVEWLLLNLATGASGLGVLQSIPLVGEAVQKMTGGYVKTGSLGQMVYDFEGAWRSGKKVVGMAGDDKVESWQDWAWTLGNLFRHLTFTTGLWKGINASSKVLSELSGLLQSLNAVFNTVRPVVQAVRNDEKKEKKFRKKMEKAFGEGRKKTNAKLKEQREKLKAKKEAEKKRKERLKRL